MWDFAQGSNSEAAAEVPTPVRKPKHKKDFQLGFA